MISSPKSGDSKSVYSPASKEGRRARMQPKKSVHVGIFRGKRPPFMLIAGLAVLAWIPLLLLMWFLIG